jgi:nitrogen fixation NifU-like protein
MMANSLLNDPEILRELIMDHYQYPHNHQLTEDKSYASVHMASDSCIDDITVQSLIRDGKIQDIRFDGVACTISTASTSMMTDLLKGKSVEEANGIIDNYFSMIDAGEYDPDVLEEAVAMKNVYKQANRIKCATIGWKAMRQMIDESEKES